MRRKLRRLAFDDRTFLWSTRWTYDRDGERILHLVVFHAVGERKRGQPLCARFVSREPAYVDTSAVLPGDARAAVDHALAHGWTGAHLHWLLPAVDLGRPGLVLAAPTRLREWSDEGPLYTLHLDGAEDLSTLAAELADRLELPADPATVGALEIHWHDPRVFLLRSRHGSVVVHTRSVADLVRALEAARACLPAVTAAVNASPAQLHGPGTGEVPPAAVVPVDRWTAVPGATRYPGPREADALWVVREPGDLHVEFYMYHHDAPTRLWLWTTLRDDAPAVTRRFKK